MFRHEVLRAPDLTLPDRFRLRIEHDIGVALEHVPRAQGGFALQLRGFPARVPGVDAEPIGARSSGQHLIEHLPRVDQVHVGDHLAAVGAREPGTK